MEESSARKRILVAGEERKKGKGDGRPGGRERIKQGRVLLAGRGVDQAAPGPIDSFDGEQEKQYPLVNQITHFSKKVQISVDLIYWSEFFLSLKHLIFGDIHCTL